MARLAGRESLALHGGGGGEVGVKASFTPPLRELLKNPVWESCWQKVCRDRPLCLSCVSGSYINNGRARGPAPTEKHVSLPK